MPDGYLWASRHRLLTEDSRSFRKTGNMTEAAVPGLTQCQLRDGNSRESAKLKTAIPSADQNGAAIPNASASVPATNGAITPPTISPVPTINATVTAMRDGGTAPPGIITA